MTTPLAAWNDGAAKHAVVEFVERTVSEAVPVEERVAVFDNDGTLSCEKPLPIQADFVLRRLHEMTEADPGLRASPALEGFTQRPDKPFLRLLVLHDDERARTDPRVDTTTEVDHVPEDTGMSHVGLRCVVRPAHPGEHEQRARFGGRLRGILDELNEQEARSA